MINRNAFFDSVRNSLFSGELDQGQVSGMTAIMDKWEESGNTDLRQLAYMLATVYHECAKTMQPITERGNAAYFSKYDPGTNIGISLGNTQIGDGARFKGRGFVQLTGRSNYAKFGNRLIIDLVSYPDKALDLTVSTIILIIGMEHGWFTGKKLSDYINDEKTDYINARRIINGLDKAKIIADYTHKFYSALEVIK